MTLVETNKVTEAVVRSNLRARARVATSRQGPDASSAAVGETDFAVKVSGEGEQT